jgi:hypothetical protein
MRDNRGGLFREDFDGEGFVFLVFLEGVAARQGRRAGRAGAQPLSAPRSL